MKQIFLLSFMILSLVSCTGKKEQLCTSSWQSEAIAIDGLNKDWGGTLRYSDTTAKLTYDVRNDSENLYLIVETDDNSMWMKLMHSGLKVSMGLKSDPKATASITLPAFGGNPFMHHCQGMPDSAYKGSPGPIPEMKDHKWSKSCDAKKDSACAKHCKEMKDQKCAKPCGAAKDSDCTKHCKEMKDQKCAKPCDAKKESACAKHCKETKDHKCPMKDQKDSGKGNPGPDSSCHKGSMPGMECADSAAGMRRHIHMSEPATTEGFKYSNGKTEGCHAEKGKISFAVGINEIRTLTYEIVIPLREIYGDGYDLARVASDKIRIEVAVDAMEKPSAHGMMPKEGTLPPCCAGAGHPGEGAHDSLAGHQGESMPGGHAGMHEGNPKGKPECKPEGKPEGMAGECKHGAPPEGMGGECKHGAPPEGMGGECMHGAPPEGMGQHFAMPDTLILFQKQSVKCLVTLATGK